MKLRSTVAEITRISSLSHATLRNAKNYEEMVKYFDFQKAVRAVLWNQK